MSFADTVDLTGESEDEKDSEELRIIETATPSSSRDKPSQFLDDYWIYAHNPYVHQPETPRIGKWLIFLHVREVDEKWAVIKQNTVDGLLGICSKVATAHPSPLARTPTSKVICVYTYDSDDVDDVTRVRDRLRVLGWTATLRYKTDQATLSGQYAHSGASNISKYAM